MSSLGQATDQASLLLGKQLKGMQREPPYRAVSGMETSANPKLSTQHSSFEQGTELHLVHAELTKRPVDGFSAGLVNDDNLFEWQVTVMGPPDTL